MMKKTMVTLLPDLASMVVGGIIWALGINIFTVPNDIAPGGATGIATVINHFTGFPVGVIIIIINIPLFILAFFFVGKRFTLKTAAAIVITSVILDVMGTFLPTFTEDKLLASIFGGVLSGVGLGIIYTRGIATGGSDLLARLIDERVSAISYAQTILLIDFIVVAAAAIAFADWRSALYAVITIALNSSLADRLLAGTTEGKLVYVITEDAEKISSAVLRDMKRGATLIPAKGCYTGKDTNVLMITIRNYELPKLKRLIKREDEKSFLIVGNATEILGKGFPVSALDKD